MATGVEGLDDEIALLRVKIKSVLTHDPENIKLIMQATDALAKLVKTRYNIGKEDKKGLKEAIVALGEGQITSVKNGYENSVRIWFDSQSNKYLYRILKDSRNTNSKNGTSISIEVKNDKIMTPGFGPLHKSLVCHFALRDINRNPKRRVSLHVNDVRITRTRPVKYDIPEGKLRMSQQVNIPYFGNSSVEIREDLVKTYLERGSDSSRFPDTGFFSVSDDGPRLGNDCRRQRYVDGASGLCHCFQFAGDVARNRAS